MRAERRCRRRDLALLRWADDAAGVVRTATGLRREERGAVDGSRLRSEVHTPRSSHEDYSVDRVAMIQFGVEKCTRVTPA